MVQVALLDAGVLERLLERDAAALHQVGGHLLELGARQRLVEVQRAVGGGRDERQVDLGRLDLAEVDLGLLGRFLQALGGHAVGRQVDAVGGLELLDEPVDDALVPVVAAEVRVAVGRLDLEHAVADLEDRHVERAATEVEHQDRLVLGALVEPVGERGGGRLVDDAQHLEAGDGAGFLGGGALGVVEVRRHGDDGLGDRVTEVGLGVALELHQRAGRDLLRGVLLAVDVVGLPVLAHVALDRTERAIGVGDRLPLGDLADEDLAGLGERDDRRRRAGALGVGDDDGIAALEYRHHRVGGSEVDSDCLGHGCCAPCVVRVERCALWSDDATRSTTTNGATCESGNLSRYRLKPFRCIEELGPNECGNSSLDRRREHPAVDRRGVDRHRRRRELAQPLPASAARGAGLGRHRSR